MFDSRDNCISKLLCLKGHFSLISREQLKIKVERLRVLCYEAKNTDRPDREFNQKCSLCLRKLINILQTSSRLQLQSLPPYDIINSNINILSMLDDCWYYHTDLRWKLNRKYEVAMICYRILLKTFGAIKGREVVDAVVECVIENRIWRIEDLCVAIISDMLKFKIPGYIIASKLNHKIELDLDQLDNAYNLSRLLEGLLKIYNWPNDNWTDNFIRHLLNLYHHNLKNDVDQLKNSLELNVKHLVGHLENESLLTVIKYMCQWIMINSDLNDGVILDYGLLMEYTACKHRTVLYTKTLTPEILPLLLRMIASSKRLISLLGNRILQYLLDRNDNKSYFNTPQIFIEEANFNMKINDCKYEDKLFIKSHREVFHDSIMRSIINHSSFCLNLETTYCTMCLIAVEIPCGFTSASLVCLAMNMQNLMLDEQNAPKQTAFHIHAIVVSFMSLLCWIHKAKVFYDYVYKIILKRAHWAPHLNPPLLSNYDHAAHHVLWNKPDLFFVDWEVRYGLWKRFRLKNDEQKLNTNI